MTYEESKHHFYKFKDISDAWTANGWLGIRKRDNKLFKALIFYSAELGAIYTDGRFVQWWDYNPLLDNLSQARVKISSFMTSASVIKIHGHYTFPSFSRQTAEHEVQKWKQNNPSSK